MKGTTNLPYKGGHSILDTTGTALPEEPTLQFADADATDDSVNTKTVVNVVRKRTQAQYDAMSAADKAKGVIEITDADAKPLFASQVRYGSVTVADALDALAFEDLISETTIPAGQVTTINLLAGLSLADYNAISVVIYDNSWIRGSSFCGRSASDFSHFVINYYSGSVYVCTVKQVTNTQIQIDSGLPADMKAMVRGVRIK